MNSSEKFLEKVGYPGEPPSLLYFHDSLYFMLVSFTTVGYGDVTSSQMPTRY